VIIWRKSPSAATNPALSRFLKRYQITPFHKITSWQ
jgi:hypothetical protein